MDKIVRLPNGIEFASEHIPLDHVFPPLDGEAKHRALVQASRQNIEVIELFTTQMTKLRIGNIYFEWPYQWQFHLTRICNQKQSLARALLAQVAQIASSASLAHPPQPPTLLRASPSFILIHWRLLKSKKQQNLKRKNNVNVYVLLFVYNVLLKYHPFHHLYLWVIIIPVVRTHCWV